jgi:DNA-binding beta-propeller fold protein YncE
LRAIRSSFVGVSGHPFGVVERPGYSFVSVSNAIEVMRNSSALAPSPVRMIPVTEPYGEAITKDGRYLLAASGSGAVVISITAAEQGGSNPIRGILTSPGGVHAVQVTVSRDGQFAFVTLQQSGTMVVFNLGAALASGFGPGNLVGTIRLGQEPVGMALSPDGRWLYATAMRRSAGAEQGTLSVIDVRRAETTPSSAIISTVPAGCQPVRVITTAGGQDVWVTARGSNALLAFSAAKLVSDPGHALIARVQVGQAPIGLVAVAGGRMIVVANSNLHLVKSATSSLAVIDTSEALAGKPALVELIRTGLLPREFALERGGKTLLVTNFSSRQLEAVDVSHLP